MYIDDGEIKYHANTKIWECTICHKESAKYNRRKILNHVNAAHAARKPLRTRTERGMRIEKPDGKILQMERDYGSIITIIERGEITVERNRILKCARCIYKPFARETKAGIKQHLTWHNEVGKANDLNPPYFPSTFSILAELYIHIYYKICPKETYYRGKNLAPDLGRHSR